MRLSDLIRPLEDALLVNYGERSIRGLSLDSRRVSHGHLFAVVSGPHCDGTRYVPDAIAHGATAVLASRKVFVPSDVALILVPNVRRALAELCAHYYGRPADFVRTVGVTGTNGKTTVAMLVRCLLGAAGLQAALISTVVHQIGTRRLPSANTTPESPDLQAFFAEMVERHIRYAVMEVSSHSLDQHRVWGIPVEVAALTNVTSHEHLDYHITFERYRLAKARLFESLAPSATAVLNADDPNCGFFADQCRHGRVMTYGLTGGTDVSATVEATDLSGMTVRLSTPVGQQRVRSPLIGGYNLENLLCGTCCGLALGLDLPAMAAGIERFTGAPGRLERIDEGQPFTVLVDYAHNNGGLQSVLTTLRPLAEPGRLIVVFGAGGDRDPSKRPLMGATASELADRVVLTADNSRSERSEDIIAAIASGTDGGGADVVVEADRREAIRLAVDAAAPGDVVLIAGKGHENTQEIEGIRHPFDDRDVARRALGGLAQRRAKRAGRGALSASGIT